MIIILIINLLFEFLFDKKIAIWKWCNCCLIKFFSFERRICNREDPIEE